MKGIKKIVSAVIAVAMILSAFSITSFAYTDVNASTNEGAAIDVLSQLQLLQGYEDGTFRPDGNITRAEFAAVVVRALGLESAASGMGGATPFKDVPANHWAAGYINLASNAGVINGRGNGIFDPNSNVLYEEAVKMVMAALGYTPAAEASGGYPGGYITVAASEGVLDGVSGAYGTKATRGCVAELVFNSLEVPLMRQTGFGTNTTYEKSSSVLLDKLDVEKVEGRVTKIPGSADTRLLSYQVEYTISKRYEISGDNRILRNVKQVLSRVDVGTTNAQDYLEQYTYAYIKDVDDEPVIMSIVPKTGKNDKQVIYADEIDMTKLSNLSNGRLYYYKDADREKTSYIKLNTSDLSCYYNGKKIDYATVSDLRDAINGKTTFSKDGINGYIEFIGDADGDGYNVAYIVDYLDMLVEEVRPANYSVYDEGNVGRIYLDEEESDYTFKIMKNNKVVGFDEIEAGDFLSICGNLEDKYLTNGTVYITNDVVQGEIDGYDEEQGIVYIDGEPYGYTDYVANDMKIGKYATFHINMAGKIAYISKQDIMGDFIGNFGFMTLMGETGVLTSAPQARILDSTGVWNTYDFASRVAVNGTTGVKASDILKNWSSYKPDDWTDCGTNTSTKMKVYSLVSYQLNASGEIRAINFNLKDKDVTDGDYAYVDFSGNYYAAANTLGSVFVTNSTSIFSINASASERYNLDESDITVSSSDVLNNYENYAGRAFVSARDYRARAVVGYNIAGRVTYSDSIMIVKGVSKVKGADGQIVTRLEGYQGGEKVTLDYSDLDTTITDKTGLSLANKSIKVGDVIVYSGSSYMADKIQIMMRPSEAISGNWVINPYSSTGKVTYFSDSTGSKTVKFMFGLVRNRSGSRVTIALDDTVAGSYDNTAKTFTGSASGVNVYVYDALNYVNPRVKDGAVGDLDYDKTADGTPYSDEGAFVMLRVENDIIIKDIVMIKGLQSSSLKDSGVISAPPQSDDENDNESTDKKEDSTEKEEEKTPVTDETKTEDKTEDKKEESDVKQEEPKEDSKEEPKQEDESSKTEEPKTEDVKEDTKPAEGDKSPSQPAEETKKEEVKEEPKNEEPKTEETKKEEPKEQPKEEPKPEAPKYETVTGTAYVVAGSTVTGTKGQQVLVNGKMYTIGTNAFSTISAAVNAVSAKGTVYVLGSTYNEDVRVSKAVTIEGDKNVYINGTFAVNVKGVTLKNLNIIYNRTTAGEPAVLLAANLTEKDVTLSGCTLLDSKKGKDAVAVKVNKLKLDVQKLQASAIKDNALKAEISKAPQNIIDSATTLDETKNIIKEQVGSGVNASKEDVTKALEGKNFGSVGELKDAIEKNVEESKTEE